MPEAAEPTPATPPNGAQPGVWVYPYRAYNFKVLIENVGEAHFTECSGLEATVHPIRYRPGGMGPVVHMIPGPVEYAGVTLRYGLTDSTALWDWFMRAVNGTVQRTNVSIALVPPSGTGELLRWNLYEAWPSQWRGAPLDAMGREIAIESLTIVFERMDRE